MHMTSRNTNRRFTPPMVGGSSLLVIFAVLCLTIFTLLTLSTVQADTRLSEASIQAVTDYYQADLQAERIFAQLRVGQIPLGVEQTAYNGSSPSTGDSSPSGSLVPPGTIYSYSCPISDTQKLSVQLHHDGTVWTIMRWQAISTVTYE